MKRAVQGQRLVTSLTIVLFVTLWASCGQRKTQTPIPTEDIFVGEPKLVTGPVGAGVSETKASYVLVEVKNNGPVTAIVGLEGELLDIADVSLGPLRVESLRMGPGERRLFALVDNKVQSLSNATSAAVRIYRAIKPPRPAPVETSMVNLFSDEGRAVVKGMVSNVTAANVSTVVLAAFYDSKGEPISRQGTMLKLDAKGARSVQFVGPKGSAGAELFIGETGP